MGKKVIHFLVLILFIFSIYRKVTTESATGSTGSNRVRTTLTIKIEGIEFDTQACMLRVKGRNIQENQYVKVIIHKYCLHSPYCYIFLYKILNILFTLYKIYYNMYIYIHVFYRWEHIIL